DLYGEVVRVDLVGQFGDDQDLATPVVLLDLDHGTHRDGGAAGTVGLLDPAPADDESARGEVGSLDPLDERVQESFVTDVGVVQVPVDAFGDLAQVVRRDVRGHPDRDPGGTVDQQVRDASRQHDGLLGAAVVVGPKVDGLLVDVPEHLHGRRCEFALGVAHGGGRVIARRPEVAVRVHQRHAHGPPLGEAYQGVVDGAVPVRVIVTHHVADDPCALEVPPVGAVSAVVHGVQHALVDRLEAVTNIGKSTAHDDRHRVFEIAALHLGLDVDRFGPVVVFLDDVRVIRIRHGCRSLLRSFVGRESLDVQETDILGVALDEGTAGFDVLPHEHAEYLVRLGGVVQGDLEQHPTDRVHGGLPQFIRVHLTQPLESLDQVTRARVPLALRDAVLDDAVAFGVGEGVVGVGSTRVPFDLVERRLGQVYVSALDQRFHETEQQGQKQCADVLAVDVGIGHEEDLVVPQLLGVEVLVDTGAQGGDDGLDLGVLEDPVDSGLLHVQDLASDRQDRLVVGVASTLGGAARRVTLDDVELALLRVRRLTVGQLAGQRGAFQEGLAAGQITCLPGGHASSCGLARLGDDVLGFAGIAFQPVT